MIKPFDMELFLTGVLTGSRATRQRHLRQARAMQIAIQKHWKRDNPWNWQLKHLIWFLNSHLENNELATRYYYSLTARLICKRLYRSDRWTQILRSGRHLKEL